MPLSHSVWSHDAKMPLQASELNDEKELELLIRDIISNISNGGRDQRIVRLIVLTIFATAISIYLNL